MNPPLPYIFLTYYLGSKQTEFIELVACTLNHLLSGTIVHIIIDPQGYSSNDKMCLEFIEELSKALNHMDIKDNITVKQWPKTLRLKDVGVVVIIEVH